MRLLSRHESGKISPTVFTGTTPPYAILSHNWGNEEFKFEDITNGTGRSKAGYRKIEFCAKQAKQDQLQYFWVDTCCIDRWNLAELAKAINSMFRWYQNAAKCYVFLSDVLVSSATDALQQSTWEASFRESKWFTRGWTLQELIAPVSVEFFSSDGYRLGDKRSLEQLIHEITSIPVKALQNHPLDEFSISERMAWASNRETTEPEDNAYCLLGILNVLMSPSYSEGKDKALKRLQSELGAVNGTSFIVPFSRNHRFIGQEWQINELEGRLFADSQTTKIAITGPGGIGKSQLSLELAYRTRQRYENCSIFWIPANDMDSFHNACAHIAEKLKIPGWDDENVDVKKLVQRHLSGKSAGQWLLIYDNADDARLGFAGMSTLQATSLNDYIPQSELGTIIFTTADSNTAETLASSHIVELQEMTPPAAQRMLEKYLDKPALTNEQPETTILLKELSCLPLAIVQAAAYVNINKKTTIKEYFELLYEQKKEVMELRNGESGVELQHSDINYPVSATCLASFKQIRDNDPLATDCLLFMACIDRKDIPLDLLSAISSLKIKDSVETLKNYALITKRPAESAFDIHRLVHLAIRKWLQAQKLLDKWTQTTITCLVEKFPNDDDGNRSKWRRFLPHAKYALANSLTGQEDEARTDLAEKCGLAFISDGRYNEAEELFLQVMETRKRVLGAEHPNTLISISNLASTYKNQGRWKEAEKLFVQVMETRKRVLGAEHPNTLISISNLASTYSDQGRWKEAEELKVQVMETRKRVLGVEHPDTLTSIGNLALTYSYQGRWKEAEELEVQVMKTRKRVLGTEHPDTLTSMANLAYMWKCENRNNDAISLMEQCVELWRRILGADHPKTKDSLEDLNQWRMDHVGIGS